MSQCVVPNWNLRQQIQDQDHHHHQQVQGDQDQNQNQDQPQDQCRSSHQIQNHHHLHDLTHFVSMSKDEEVAELTWENGQLTMNGFNGLLPPPPLKPTWARAGETLESIVHQATTIMPHMKHNQDDQFSQFLDQGPSTMISQVHGSAGKWLKNSGNDRMGVSGPAGKRLRHVGGAAVSDQEIMGAGASASASANFCRENNENNTNMTWGASFESAPRSLNLMSRRTSKTIDDDSICLGDSENREEIEEDYEEERETKEEISGRSHSINRRSRAAAVHNLSERKRRDRINQKMKTLQKLVPNASKTDKASMLDEVIDYLKQLQGQVHMMNAVRNNMNNMSQMSQMMMTPMGMQQQMQMSLLARMGMGGVGLGMGMGMGMGGIMDINTMAAAAAAASSRAVNQHPTPNNIPPHPSLVLPSMIQMQNPTQNGSDHAQATRGGSNHPFNDPYAAFLAQSMNMDLYNKMATLYREQVNQGIKQQNMGSSSPQVMSKGNNNMI